MTPKTRHMATSSRSRLLIAGLLVLLVSHASAQMHLDGQVIASGGGSSRSAGGCLQLRASIGQPVIGSASAGNLLINSGYLPATTGRQNSLFNSGFEECL